MTMNTVFRPNRGENPKETAVLSVPPKLPKQNALV